LIILDSINRKLSIQVLANDQLELATEEYARVEARAFVDIVDQIISEGKK
jgi:hypothetical protein